MEGLKDKVIVFAGAGGIATATAQLLGQGGAKVVAGDVVLAAAERAARTCEDAGGEAVAAVADISDEEQVKNLIDLALSKYGKQRVRANSVSPGLVLTEQLQRHLSPEVRDEVLKTTPSFRHGEPADIGAMAAFLLSDVGEWVTGQAISVDGGTTMRP